MPFVQRLPEKFVSGYKSKLVPWGPVGFVTYKRTYARKKDQEGVTEDWYETVARCVNGALDIGLKMTEDEVKELYDMVFNLKCTFSGRALWQMGTKTVEKLGGDSVQNCWCLPVSDPIKPFIFTFDELMLGGGVGYNIQREYVYEIPKIKHDVKVVRKDDKDVDFIVPDNREGWVELLRRVLEAFFFTGKSFSYSTICIRPKGAPIKGFGGVASGPEDLCKGIGEICTILHHRYDKKLRPIDCLDILNIIGSIVVSGNVRRSAQLALGDVDDQLFLDAKTWSKGSIPNWRAMSNNSVVANHAEELSPAFWRTYGGGGESYGIINLRNFRRFGRIADGSNYRPDNAVVGTNPCAEIGLNPFEACNLAEIFLPNIKNEAEFKRAAMLMYKVIKSISCMKFIHDETNDVVAKNHRLGLGVTGFLQSDFVNKPDVFTSVYKHVEELDKAYSKSIGVKESIKLTTVKPSGTVSLLPGVTPGVHPAFSQHYIRRIRMAASDPLVEACRVNGYRVEPQIQFDGSYNMDTMVVEFPVSVPQGTVLAKDVSAIKQLEYQKFLQTYWADNSVSVTVYYSQEELPAIKEWLNANYDDSVKSVSFLLRSGHGFKQAPYEEISEETYKKTLHKVKPITMLEDKEVLSLAESLECSSGACPIR